jgi:hypothetical protein
MRFAGKVSTEHGDIESNRDQEAPEEARPPQKEAALPFLSGRLQSFATTDLRRFQGSEDAAADDRSGGAHPIASPHGKLRQVSTGRPPRSADGAIHGAVALRFRGIARFKARAGRARPVAQPAARTQESPWSRASPLEIQATATRGRTGSRRSDHSNALATIHDMRNRRGPRRFDKAGIILVEGSGTRTFNNSSPFAGPRTQPEVKAGTRGTAREIGVLYIAIPRGRSTGEFA